MSNFQNGVQLSVAGKVALITGGSRGIGAATVKMFCAAGAKVAFNYKKAKDAADRVIAECGTNVCAIQSDLSSPGDAEQLIKVVVGNLGRLDCLVANHGIWPPDDAPVDEMPDDQWRRTIAVNLDSVFGLIKHGVAQMKSQRRGPGQAAGRIVIISSTAGQRGEAFHCDYAASKGGVMLMMKTLAQECAPFRIRVNSIGPGAIRTPINRSAWETPEAYRELLKLIPYKRIGEPEDIAKAAVWLASDQADYVTGTTLFVDGGMTLYPGFETGG